jgi:predicted CXXCH cytochrome family protein
MRPVLLAILLLIPALSHGADAEKVIRGIGNAKVIRSTEPPHTILNDACVACHPREKFDYWLLIYKGKAPILTIDRGEATGEPHGASKAPAAKKSNRYNAHDAIACNFCHFENPSAATPKFIVDVGDLCGLCHPAIGLHHLPDAAGKARVKKAILEKKLPGRDGEFLCTTCHKTHDSTYSMRQVYAETIWEGRVPDPHGKRMLCFACHAGRIREGEEVRFAGGRDNIKLCNGCHAQPGVKKAPHVVDVTSSDGTWRMDYLGFPLSQGKLICSTCHDEVSHGKPDSANPNFLRGGPYPDADRFCYRCHLEDKEMYSNPHRQVDAFGRIRPESCRFCHRSDPDPGRKTPANLDMTGDDTVMCSRCHQVRPHPGVDHLVLLKGEKASRKTEYEERQQVFLPLSPDGKITCSTCHNPHAKGVLKGEAGVGAGSKWRVPDFREVCAPCHGRY